MYDIIYFLKESKTNEELRYSLRSLYANYFKIGGKQMCDVKVTSKTKILVGTEYISTDENSFNGKIGDYIKQQFLYPSKYEI